MEKIFVVETRAARRYRPRMPLTLSKEQKADLVSSVRRYFAEELDQELSEMKAGFLLEYLLTEVGPIAYNKGVEDAQRYFMRATEDLPGTCFQEPLTYWSANGRSRSVRRKPDV